MDEENKEIGGKSCEDCDAINCKYVVREIGCYWELKDFETIGDIEKYIEKVFKKRYHVIVEDENENMEDEILENEN